MKLIQNEDDLNIFSKVLDLEEDTVEVGLNFEERFLTDNCQIFKELKENSNIVIIIKVIQIEYSIEKNSDLLKINVLGEKNSIDNFKQLVKLQLFYFEKYE